MKFHLQQKSFSHVSLAYLLTCFLRCSDGYCFFCLVYLISNDVDVEDLCRMICLLTNMRENKKTTSVNIPYILTIILFDTLPSI